MAEGFWFVLLMIALVLIYALSRVVTYSRRSDEQWKQVDKSKLTDWADDDEW